MTSDEIFLSLGPDQLKLVTGGKITLKTEGFVFKVDKLIDNVDERFKISIVFIPSVAPVHRALRDFILLSDSKLAWEEPVGNLLEY